jgi:putrescine transport system substrate-binding protein
VTDQLATYDPGNNYAANYMWGTTGIGYNVKTAAENPRARCQDRQLGHRLQAGESRKFKDCGIHMLDSADDICPRRSAISDRSELDQTGRSGKGRRARQQDQAQRPQVSFLRISGRAGVGEICFVVGWSGDIMQARSRAAEAKNGIEIGYTIPKEGAQMFFDNLAIPADAKNVAEAYELINYLYRPDVAAKNSDFLSYANGNLASQKLVDPKILNDKNIYPDEATQKKLFVINARDPATQRIINRLWTRVKTGK